MGLANYDELIQSLSKWSKRGDLSDLYPDFILLAEKEIDKHLQLRDNETRSTAVPTTDDRFIVLPDDFLEMRSLRVLDGDYHYKTCFTTPEDLNVCATAGRPYFFTVNEKLEMDRIPDKLYTLEMTYFVELTPLSDTNETNNVLTRYPELYLNGALVALHRYARDEETAQYYAQVFMGAIHAANKQEARGRYGPAPQMRTKGSTP